MEAHYPPRRFHRAPSVIRPQVPVTRSRDALYPVLQILIALTGDVTVSRVLSLVVELADRRQRRSLGSFGFLGVAAGVRLAVLCSGGGIFWVPAASRRQRAAGYGRITGALFDVAPSNE